MNSNTNKGIYLALIATVISGFSIFLNKFALIAIKQPLVFTAVKNSFVGIFIIATLLMLGKMKGVRKLDRKDVVYLFLIGVIGGSLPFYLFFTGLSQIPAVNAAIIQKTLVVWVAILAIPFLKERMSKPQIIGVVMLFAGNLIVGGFKGFSFSKGEFFVLLATILWGIENVLAKKALKNIDPDIVTAVRMGFGSLILLVAAAITNPTALAGVLTFTSKQWFWLILSSLLLLGYVMSWYRALQKAPATLVTSILVGSTLITSLLSAVFITRSVNSLLNPQTLLMTAGATILIYSSRRKETSVLGV